MTGIKQLKIQCDTKEELAALSILLQGYMTTTNALSFAHENEVERVLANDPDDTQIEENTLTLQGEISQHTLSRISALIGCTSWAALTIVSLNNSNNKSND
jgi:hypothetical protein